MRTEIWKDVVSFEGIYQISDCGKVRAIKTGKVLKPDIVQRYLRVRLYKNKIVYRCLIHRLVLEAFIGFSTPERWQCNHKDGVKGNNDLSNLEWVTPSENMKHAIKMNPNLARNAGRFRSDNDPRIQRGSAHYLAKLTEADIPKIRADQTANSIIATRYGVTRRTISFIKHRQSWKHVP